MTWNLICKVWDNFCFVVYLMMLVVVLLVTLVIVMPIAGVGWLLKRILPERLYEWCRYKS